MRPEPGRTQGVDEWAAGAHYCRVVCTRDHPKRTIERIKWAGPRGRGAHLYTAGVRTLDDPEKDPGTSAELNPVTDEYKWRLRCPCGIDVVIGSDEILDGLAKTLSDQRVSRIELSDLARYIGKQHRR